MKYLAAFFLLTYINLAVVPEAFAQATLDRATPLTRGPAAAVSDLPPPTPAIAVDNPSSEAAPSGSPAITVGAISLSGLTVLISLSAVMLVQPKVVPSD